MDYSPIIKSVSHPLWWLVPIVVVLAILKSPCVAEDSGQMAVLLPYHQTFVDAVRETGGRNAYRVLVVQGPRTDITLSNSLWGAMPTDTVANRQMVEVHYYDPFNFTLMSQDEVWGNQHYYWGAPNQSTTDTTRNSTWGDEVHTDTQFGLMKTKFIDLGIPVILGEFAAMRRDTLTGDALALHLQSRRYYHQYVVKSAVANGLRPFFWDVGSFAGGVFDRANNTVSDPAALAAMQQGALGVPP